MKKIIIFPGYFLPHVGGLETHVDEFAKYISSHYEITIFAPNIPTAKSFEMIHDTVKVIRFPAFEIVSNFPLPKFWSPMFWKVFISLYGKEFDWVMTRTRFFSNALLGLFLAKFRFNRIKLIHVEHGSDFVKLGSKFKTFIAKCYDLTFGKLVFFCADEVVAISDAVFKFVSKHFIKKRKIHLIRRGVDFEKYGSIPQKGKKIKMCYLGRLYAWKGVENSIKAYKNLPLAYRKNADLVIVGSGEELKRLKREAGKVKGIYFLGEKPFSEAIDILKSSHIYLHSSYPGGGLSNSLLQAMYCKCAVIASPHEGGAEVISSNGILLKENTPSEISSAMMGLIDDASLRLRLGASAHAYIKRNFGWNKVVKKYQEVLK